MPSNPRNPAVERLFRWKTVRWDRDRDLTPWAGLFPLDEATPITCVHLGIEYYGEVVRATRWSPDLGGAPSNGSHFKIVLLQNRPRLGFSTSLHARTAVCIPEANAGRQAQRIIGEITGAKQAAYPK